jgi:hypothetical protein
MPVNCEAVHDDCCAGTTRAHTAVPLLANSALMKEFTVEVGELPPPPARTTMSTMTRTTAATPPPSVLLSGRPLVGAGVGKP